MAVGPSPQTSDEIDNCRKGILNSSIVPTSSDTRSARAIAIVKYRCL
jgi:hypothetical protein